MKHNERMLQEKNKTRYDCVEKVIHWELCQEKKKKKEEIYQYYQMIYVRINENLSWRIRRIKFSRILIKPLNPRQKSKLSVN